MKHAIIFLLLSVSLVLIFTFPLILKFNAYIPGFYSTDEPYGTLWNFWWLKYSYLNHLDTYLCTVIAAPFGLDLAGAPVYPVLDFMNKFLTIGFGSIFTYNLEIIASFLLTALFMYLLVFNLTNNRPAALLSGIILNFCPYHIIRTWQHPGLAQIQWLPLYILSLYKLKENPSLRNTILSAISFSLVALFNYYYVYFSFVIMVTFVVFIFLSNKKNNLRIVKNILISMAITFLILSPIILPILKRAYFSPKTENLVVMGYLRQFRDLFEQSARPLSYFLPAPAHPVFGKFTEQFIGSSLYGISSTEHTLYLGWVPFILALVAFKRWRKMRKAGRAPLGEIPYEKADFYIGFFVFLAIVAWIFSQPPWWNMGPMKIYMPSFFMYKIFPMFRAYCRFAVVVMLAVAVLAGYGLKFVLERFNNQRLRLALACLFSGLVLFEFWSWPPYKVIDVSKVPAVYYWLKAQPHTLAIAEYPLDADSPNEMYKFYQTVHEKKIINGTPPGGYANKIAHSIRNLSELKTAQTLKWLGVKYVLVHWQGYMDTGLVDDGEELNAIPKNPGIRLIGTFSSQECPRKDIMCIQKTGKIDVYEVQAPPVKPANID